jgi:hypothetical protein
MRLPLMLVGLLVLSSCEAETADDATTSASTGAEAEETCDPLEVKPGVEFAAEIDSGEILLIVGTLRSLNPDEGAVFYGSPDRVRQREITAVGAACNTLLVNFQVDDLEAQLEIPPEDPQECEPDHIIFRLGGTERGITELPQPTDLSGYSFFCE